MTRGDQRHLGANLTATGANFAIWAPSATAVQLSLIDLVDGEFHEERINLVDRNGPIYHCHIEGVRAGQRYGFRVDGPWDPQNGWRFNPHKLLLDPTAHLLAGELQYVPEIYSHHAVDGIGTGDLNAMDTRDNMAFVPHSVVIESHRVNDTRPLNHWSQTIIYEAHVRGLTEFNHHIPEDERGTYKALGHPSTIDYLKTLGITALELLPIQEFLTEPGIKSRGRINHWGYNPIAFSAPHLGYAATDDPVTELREAVAKLHAAGIEVILDVVYNHSAEGGPGGPTLSLRGIDSRNYYRRKTADTYDDFTGCGNTLDIRRPHVVRMIVDSLYWWTEVIGVDGFRFDLAAALARSHDEIDGISALLVAMVADPVLRERKLIAEPWDVRGYAGGFFPYPWREWNDKYRNALRKFWLEQPSESQKTGVGEIATRLSGSQDIFAYRGPTSNINFLTAHDGFTLHDLVTYNHKHNEANGEDNRDGSDDNNSWNFGTEGETDIKAVNDLRQRLKKSMMSCLLMSAGIPMITMGDEVGRSQGGSNNAYSLPANKRSFELRGPDAFNGGWALDWKLDTDQIDMLETTVNLIELRKVYLMPVVRMFFTGELDLNTSRRDLAWFSQDGLEMTAKDWENPENQSLMMFVEASDSQGLLLIINAGTEPAQFTLPGGHLAVSYRSVFDSAENVISYRPLVALPGDALEVQAHASMVWLVNHG
jgi:glycogen operon protein